MDPRWEKSVPGMGQPRATESGKPRRGPRRAPPPADCGGDRDMSAQLTSGSTPTPSRHVSCPSPLPHPHQMRFVIL